MAACLRVYPGAQQVRMYKLLARRVHHQEGLHLLKDSPADASCRRQLEHVGEQALIQPPDALPLHRLAHDIQHPIVFIGLSPNSLHLHPGAHQRQRVRHKLGKRAREGPDGQDAGRRRRVAVVSLQQHVLQNLKRGDVHPCVWQNSDQRGEQATVECHGAFLLVDLDGRIRHAPVRALGAQRQPGADDLQRVYGQLRGGSRQSA
mmetsp:Transcript_41333/g.105696  ORF Transcript_41333/g.105696 Transcript_41333/m.105696 type:complete len:204 (-) Transcript_41333:441-1052(-)